jgi:2-dehydropantoate 2-reductase
MKSQPVREYNPSRPQNILVYGAGVLGSLYAARLQEAGHNVSLLARGQRLADLREYGIVLEDEATGQRTTARVNVTEQLMPDETYDLVIVVMRKNQVSAVLPALAANRHTPNVLFLINNAAGPDEYIRALGRERVLLGFVGAGGTREGHVVRYVSAGKAQPTTLGEVDGRITPRLKQVAQTLQSARFAVSFSDNMDAWLKTHVAVVSPLANAVYMAGGDNYRLARTRDGLVLCIRAVREGFRVLRTLNIPITPGMLRILEWLPEPLLVAVLHRRFPTRQVELAVARHANAARDEMQQLADEFRVLAEAASIPTPAIDRLRVYIDPAVPPIDEGSAQIPLSWAGLVTSFEVLVGVLSVLRLLRRRRPIATLLRH